MTFTDSHPICELHNPDNIVKGWWGVQLIQVRWNQLVTGLSAGELFFWVLPRTEVQNGEFRHKPSTVNCFNCLWSNVKQEPREQLKFLGYWLNSVISYKYRWLVLGNYFLVLSRTVVKNGEFKHKPSTVNCFNCLWSGVKQEPREQLKFLAYWLNSF